MKIKSEDKFNTKCTGIQIEHENTIIDLGIFTETEKRIFAEGLIDEINDLYVERFIPLSKVLEFIEDRIPDEIEEKTDLVSDVECL